ncbi:hypothetical protein QK290_00940 [Pseudarthrobacter sp. AL07]|uniref:hypothetical protein n=1 Tax=Pseudarthrobacter sp. AL07 TaxID=3042233 RepID=UPI00249CCEA5|nr:hypothetical protein [Pseudarthrobacter sp. AL07]MDI3207116.1 hypothetical protein [Pseudarthrobacter sp. AL07]
MAALAAAESVVGTGVTGSSTVVGAAEGAAVAVGDTASGGVVGTAEVGAGVGPDIEGAGAGLESTAKATPARPGPATRAAAKTAVPRTCSRGR